MLGPNADHAYNMLGDYTSPQREGQVITVLQGIRAMAAKETEVMHVRGCGIKSTDESGLAEAVRAAASADVAILCLGGASTREFGAVFDKNGAIIPGQVEAEMDCGEGVDAASLRLPGLQEEMFRRVAATGTPIVVVLVQGRPYAIPEIAREARAILAAWYPGTGRRPCGGRSDFRPYQPVRQALHLGGRAVNPSFRFITITSRPRVWITTTHPHSRFIRSGSG